MADKYDPKTPDANRDPLTHKPAALGCKPESLP